MQGYDTWCAVGDFIPKSSIPTIEDVANIELKLSIDGQRKQHGNTKDMIFTAAFLIEYISQIMTLEKDDLILTGLAHV